MGKPKMINMEKIMADVCRTESNITPLIIHGENNDFEISVKKKLSLTEHMAMISGIADMMFTEDENGHEQYCPYNKRFAIGYHIIAYFTNIKIPSKAEAIWDFITETDIVAKVLEELPNGYLNVIIDEANEMIVHRKTKIEKETQIGKILSGVVGLINVINEKIESSDGKMIMEWLDQNAPDLKSELSKVLRDESLDETEHQ